MRYMFLIYLDEQTSAGRSEAEAKAGMAAHVPYIEMLRRNGQYVASDALAAAQTSRTLRASDGKVIATDGPFAESREQFGGYYVVEAADLDVAIELAAECPALRTVGIAIEVRPILSSMFSAEEFSTRYFFSIYGAEREAVGDLDRGRWAAAAEFSAASSATTVRLREGKIVLSDGPFAERGEQMLGYRVVSARDLDDAASIAAALPEARLGAIEVRAVRSAPGG